MIKRIENVDSKKGSGVITFDVDVDNSGAADEDVSALIDHTNFVTHVKVPPGDGSGQSLSHTKHGLLTFHLHAEKGNVSSGDVTLDL